MEKESSIEKVYNWVGPLLSSCPVRDGVTFYYNSEKLFKVLNKKRGWHIEFNVPVPECQGLIILTDEEARIRKLGKTRWIFKGESELNAHQLIEAALGSIPKRRVIEPALSRETRTISDYTCPCLKRVEQIQHSATLPTEIVSKVKESYDILHSGHYSAFVPQIYLVLQDILDYLLFKNGLKTEGDLEEKLRVLAEHQIIPQIVRQELQSYITRKVFEREFINQERAYPIALMLVNLTGKLLNLCN